MKEKLKLEEYKEPCYKFDWCEFVLRKLLRAFPRQALTGSLIPKKEVNRRLGLFLTMKKTDLKIMLRTLEANTDGLIHLNQRGLHINPEKLNPDQRAEILQVLNRGKENACKN